MSLTCSECSACCYHFSIEEIAKEYCTWCKHSRPAKLKVGIPATEIKGGCGIYENRPQPCRDYKCMWLISQERPGQEMPLAMRPDRSKVMFSVSPENKKHIYAHVNPVYPDAWKRGKVWEKIQDIVARDGTVEVVIGAWRNLLRKGKPVVRFHESVYDKAQQK